MRMLRQCTRLGFRRTLRDTTWSAACARAWVEGRSWNALLEHKANAADRVQQLLVELLIQLSPQSRDGHIDHIIERCLPSGFFPHFPRNHLAGHDSPLMFHQVMK